MSAPTSPTPVVSGANPELEKKLDKTRQQLEYAQLQLDTFRKDKEGAESALKVEAGRSAKLEDESQQMWAKLEKVGASLKLIMNLIMKLILGNGCRVGERGGDRA